MQTARLILRPLRADDASRIAELAGAWEVASMTGRIPFPYSADAAQHWLTGLAEGEVVFGIQHQHDLIGICGYSRETDGSHQLGYWIGKPYWGHGFATEAAKALIDFGFKKGGVKKFNCRHFVDNPASGQVITKLGFRKSGTDSGWCEARQAEFPTIAYHLRRPWTLSIKARAS